MRVVGNMQKMKVFMVEKYVDNVVRRVQMRELMRAFAKIKLSQKVVSVG